MRILWIDVVLIFNIDEVKVDQLDSDENMDFEHDQGDVDVR